MPRKRKNTAKRNKAIRDAATIKNKSLTDFDHLVNEKDELSANRKWAKDKDPRVFTQRRKAVELLMAYGNDNADIAAAMEVNFGIQYVQTQRLIKATERKWRESENLSTGRRKEQARARILADKKRAAADGAHGAVMTAEALLMKLEGTEAPKVIEVKVDVTERMMNAIARSFMGLTPERMQAVALGGMARAAALQAKHPEVIDAEFTALDEEVAKDAPEEPPEGEDT